VEASSEGLRIAGVGGEGETVLPLSVPGLTGEIEFGMRPEHLSLLPRGEPRPDGGLLLEGKVKLVEELGSESFVHINLADGTPVTIRAGRDPAVTGGSVRAVVDARRALLFAKDGQRVRARAGERGE
jgi:lactose/L-arabinose transport system ATP-binding protein